MFNLLLVSRIGGNLIPVQYLYYVRRTSLRYVSILFFIHLYIKIDKDWVMVLDSSDQEAQDFKSYKNFKNLRPFKKLFKIFKIVKILGFLARGTFLTF